MIRLLPFAFGCSLCLLAGCERPKPPVVPTKPPEVIVAHPTEETVVDTEDFTGRTEAVARVELRSRVTGYLDGIHFKDGADLKKGDLLFTIDPRTYQAELERAQASVRQAEATYSRTKKDFDRMSGLRSTGAVTQEEYDRFAGDYAVADAAVGVSKAALSLARQNLDFTRVTAPFDGRISRRQADVGNLVKADDTLLSEMLQLAPIYVNFDVDDRTLLRIRRLVREGKVTSARNNETVVKVGTPDRDTYDLSATVDFIDTKLDPGAGTLRLRAVMANKDTLLSPGLFVRVRLPVGNEYKAVLVPEEAVGTDQGEKFVYVIQGADSVEYRPVKLGAQHGAKRVVSAKDPGEGGAVRKSGVSPQDRIVVSGLQRVRAGGKVTVKEAGAQAAAGAAPKAPAAP